MRFAGWSLAWCVVGYSGYSRSWMSCTGILDVSHEIPRNWDPNYGGYNPAHELSRSACSRINCSLGLSE
jgi:hypothetical protein